MASQPNLVIISIIVIGIIGIGALAISQESSKESSLSLFSQSEILPLQLDKIINSCNQPEPKSTLPLEWSTGTYFTNNKICKWEENANLNAKLTSEESIDEKINKLSVQNLVRNLMETYDKEGLENLNQADFVMITSTTQQSTRNLFIIDPATDTIIGNAGGEKYQNIPRATLIQDSTAYFDLIADSDENGFWLEETFTLKEMGISFDQLVWLVPHDGLIFGTSYVIDNQGRSFN